MDKYTKEFINNVNKSNQKPVEFIVKPKDDLDLTVSEACIFIAIIFAIGFITYLTVGG